ncbi:right-handed parallel beta-helix repeat-containing protein [Aurantiacibacter rhizosphaerae]|uniref:Right-handed parallel beta-helix repeat-containing protein n=1 Tax=Aurantiacibacter rhizosphaerae TaxID=2691582 RepID=A0A844XAJ7_9SPHN|nr:right-handed parallel beta-helix repeat-containing protein [Aurantiacibacter rhizosphaerae]MWV26555.1 right-handed parallel beta-helix repeat-containing protein [Aurantiacibacter rhizosphaerae]
MISTTLRAAPHRISLKVIGAVGAIAVAAIPAAALLAQDRAAAFTVVETGQGYDRLQDAVDAIGNARGTIAIAPGRYEQCAVQEGGDVSFFATQPGSAVFDGVTCEGKAALVLRGRSAEVSGIVFQNMRVPDYNGSGIRLEQGDLTVAESWFRDSQQGILTHNDTGSQLVIDRSTFTRLGTCEGSGGCAHSIYTGEYGQVRITRSRFEQGRGGHYVKARAVRVDIASSSFDDAAGRGTNYMIDLPGGASGQISNNWFVQGQDKENYAAFIAVAAEGRAHDSANLSVVGNDARFASGVDRNSIFVADWSGDMGGVGENALDSRLTRYEVIR